MYIEWTNIPGCTVLISSANCSMPGALAESPVLQPVRDAYQIQNFEETDLSHAKEQEV